MIVETWLCTVYHVATGLLDKFFGKGQITEEKKVKEKSEKKKKKSSFSK